MEEGSDAEVAPQALVAVKLSPMELARLAKSKKRKGKVTADTFYQDDAAWADAERRLVATHDFVPGELDDVPLLPGFTTVSRRRDLYSLTTTPKRVSVWRVVEEDASLGAVLTSVLAARQWAAKWRQANPTEAALLPPAFRGRAQEAIASGVMAYGVPAYDQSPSVRKLRKVAVEACEADPSLAPPPPPHHAALATYTGNVVSAAPAIFGLLTPSVEAFPCRCVRGSHGKLFLSFSLREAT